MKSLFLAVLFFSACAVPNQQPKLAPATPYLDPPKLQLLSSKMMPADESMASVHGEIKNIGSIPIDGTIVVLISVYDRKGNILRTLRTSPDIHPLNPGTTSPFDAMITDIPGYATYKIAFADLDGKVIESKN